MQGQGRQILRLAVILVATITMSAVPAAAQCPNNPPPYGVDQSNNGTLRLQASTTQCSGTTRTNYVKARIADHVFSCASGYVSGFYCQQHTANANAVVTIVASDCGAWQGLSDHWFVQGETTTTVQTNKSTTLYAGACYDPQAECEAQGQDYYWNGFECVYAPGSPIVIATSHRARYKFTSTANGVMFDINGDGVPEQIAWTEAGSDVAFLALDRDEDGRITSGRELFGNHTIPGSPNGFDSLMRTAMDTNGGVIRPSVSSDDPVFARLLLWTDRNHNGISEPDELRPASDLLAEIGLGYSPTDRKDKHGNLLLYQGWARVRTAPGRNKARNAEEESARRLIIWDVFLKFQ